MIQFTEMEVFYFLLLERIYCNGEKTNGLFALFVAPGAQYHQVFALQGAADAGLKRPVILDRHQIVQQQLTCLVERLKNKFSLRLQASVYNYGVKGLILIYPEVNQFVVLLKKTRYNFNIF